jgi:protein-L-isoaspartate(D-aspartate) O-methyltransferase
MPMFDFLAARQKMVDGQVRTNDVTDSRIIDAMLMIPREQFVPEDRQALAYLDIDLEVSTSGARRCLLKPAVAAKLLQGADIKQTDSVLVVGCATGYTAAIAAALADRVTATDPDPSLVERAKRALLGIGHGAVAVKAAPILSGDESSAPFDVIVLDGATEIVPEPLYRQLKEGGRFVGMFAASVPQRAMLVTHSRGDFGYRALFDGSATLLPGLERKPEFVF